MWITEDDSCKHGIPTCKDLKFANAVITASKLHALLLDVIPVTIKDKIDMLETRNINTVTMTAPAKKIVQKQQR